MTAKIGPKYVAGYLSFDFDSDELYLHGVRIHLQPKQTAVLRYLIQNRHRLVSRDELYRAAHGETFVEEQSINRFISELRQVLGHDAIETRPRKGYRLVESFFFRVDQSVSFCPWKGFMPYLDGDEGLFFGRHDVADEVIRRLEINPYLLTVFGPSGSGKTSLVSAGVIPRLKLGDVFGIDQWEFLTIQPGRYPILAMSTAIAFLERRLSTDAPELSTIIERINTTIQHKYQVLVCELDELLGDRPLFIFVDQIEDLFATDVPMSHRSLFLSTLVGIAGSQKSMRISVISLRDSFHAQLAGFPEIYLPATANMVPIGPLSRSQLKRIIEAPAARANLVLDEGLADQIVDEIWSESSLNVGTLPLLSNFLIELFEARENNSITFDHYRSIGGVNCSIADHANRVFENFTGRQREMADKLLVLLTNVGETSDHDTCKTVRLDEILRHFDGHSKDVTAIIEILVEKRLVVAFDGPDSTLELPHISLIKNWPRMQGLLRVRRGAIRFADGMRKETQQWLENGEKDDDLLKGSQLHMARELYNDYEFLIDEREKGYYRRSVDISDQRNRQRWWLKATIAICVILFVIFIFASLVYKSEIDRSKAAQNAAAVSRVVLESDPAKALEYAIQAVESEGSKENESILRAAVARSSLRFIMKGHSDAITSLAVSNDGRFLVTASRDGTAKVWESATGKLLFTFSEHTLDVESVAISPDDRYVVTGGSDGTVRIWDSVSGAPTYQLTHYKVNNVAFSPDGKSVLGAAQDNFAFIWNFETKDQPVMLVDHDPGTAVNTAVYSNDGSLIATAGGDKTAKIWDVKSKKVLKSFVHPRSVLNLAFSPDGTILATACGDGIVRLYLVESGRELTQLREHRAQVNCLAFDKLGDRIVTASMDATSIVWDWRSGTVLNSLTGNTSPLTSAAFSPDGKTVFTAGTGKEVRVWDVSGGLAIQTIPPPEGVIRSLAIAPGSSGRIAWAMADTRIVVRDLASGENDWSLSLDKPIVGVRFSPNSHLLAIADADRTITIWAVRDVQPTWRLTGHQSDIRALAFTSSGDRLASGDSSGTVKVWDLNVGRELASAPPDANSLSVSGLSFSADGQILAASGFDRAIRFYKASDLKPYRDPWKIGSGEIYGVALHGADVLAACRDRSIRVLDMQTGDQVAQYIGHGAPVARAVYSPGGEFVASVADDRTMRIWSTFLGRDIYRLYDPPTRREDTVDAIELRDVVFSNNGREVIYSTRDGGIRAVDCEVCVASKDDLLELARKHLPQVVEDH